MCASFGQCVIRNGAPIRLDFFCWNNWKASWNYTPSVLICCWSILWRIFYETVKKLLLWTMAVAKDFCADAAALARLDSRFTADNVVLFHSWLLRKPLCTATKHMAVRHLQMWVLCFNVTEARLAQFTFHIKWRRSWCSESQSPPSSRSICV